jgi:hypothetical protein
MATFAIILNKCEMSFGQDEVFKPQYFENKNKLHVFLKKNGLWLILISLEKTYPVSHLARTLELISHKVE